MTHTECLECGADVAVTDDVMQGEILTCDDCGAELEVLELEPLVLEMAPLEMEDWGMSIGILCSRVRVEEKLLFMAFDTLGTPAVRLDERDIAAHVGSFTPAVDGSVPEDRVLAFLEVREAIRPVHAEIEDVDREMADFEDLAEDEQPPMRVALPAIASLTKNMMSLPKVFGAIEVARNGALVEVGMGLGEYTYIFATAYHGQILDPDPDVHLFSSSPTNERVRGELREMIRRQLDAAGAATEVSDEWTAALAAELEALVADDQRILWQDGLPETIAASFAPHRARLDDTYSAASAEFELLNSTVRNGGLQITMN